LNAAGFTFAQPLPIVEDMEISSVAADVSSRVAAANALTRVVGVMKKQQDVAETTGQALVQLIESASSQSVGRVNFYA
jgi:hypothetical protein